MPIASRFPQWLPRWGLLIVCLSLLLAAPAPGSVQAQDPCDGLVPPRLAEGGYARVTAPYGVSLKDGPRTGAAGGVEVTHLPLATTVTVTGAYRCNFGYRWWPVALASGVTGWAAEGNSAEYFMEPYTVGLHVFRRLDRGARLARYFVTPDGSAALLGVIEVGAVEATPAQVWQPVELQRLDALLSEARADCPERLAGTPFAEADTLETARQLPLPPLDYDLYPAPGGERLVLVRHLRLDVPRCDTVLREPVGISRVIVLAADGMQIELFPFPQHGSIPESSDWYAPGEPSLLNVYLEDVLWSPDERLIAFSVAYRDTDCNGTCYRFHLYVWNLETGQLYAPGEGRHPGWTGGGSGLNFFRLVRDTDGRPSARLFTARAEGSDRQEIWLPGGAVYVSDTQQALGLPWNPGGTRLMVANAGAGEVMVLNVADRAFTPPVRVPDLMPPVNRFSVHLVQGETVFLWTTIRGDFVTQAVETGRWDELASTVATTGSPVAAVRPFGPVNTALVELAGGSAYVLDFAADTLVPVAFAG